MPKYMIHCCKQREWYVHDYLLPSMYAQGIVDDDILIKEDLAEVGNLEACMQSFQWLSKKKGATWHLQDDVILCKDFAERTRYLDETETGIMCGFTSEYDKHEKDRLEYVTPKDMWYSFCCIRIPNKLAGECSKWFYDNKVKFDMFIKNKKYDDSVFKEFMETFYPDMKVKNLIPNLVDHIDYLLGGSIANNNRIKKQVRSLYWEDYDLIEQLEKSLQ